MYSGQGSEATAAEKQEEQVMRVSHRTTDELDWLSSYWIVNYSKLFKLSYYQPFRDNLFIDQCRVKYTRPCIIKISLSTV